MAVITGRVDEFGRALVRVRLRPNESTEATEIDAWVDTAFTGDLVLPTSLIQQLGLTVDVPIRASLADGSQPLLDTYHCFIEWGDQIRGIEVIQGRGQIPRLGVSLLVSHRLHVDYPARTLTIE